MKKIWVAFFVLFISFGAQAGTIITRGVTDPLGIDGITPPGGVLLLTGQIKITGGTPAAGEILTSDGAGLATWEPGTLKAECVDIDQDDNCEIDGTDNTTIDFDPDDDSVFNMRIIDNAGGWCLQRLDTTWKNVLCVADDTGNLIWHDGAEGTFTVQGTVGDVFVSAVGDLSISGSNAFYLNGDLGSIRINGLSNVLSLVNSSSSIDIFSTLINISPGAGIADMMTLYPPIENTTPAEPVVCNAVNEDALVKVDDTNDGAAVRWCWCSTADDGSTFDWRAFDDPVGTACPFF